MIKIKDIHKTYTLKKYMINEITKVIYDDNNKPNKSCYPMKNKNPNLIFKKGRKW